MIQSSSLITEILKSLNSDADFKDKGIAVRAFEIATLPVPLKTAYFSVSAAKNSVSFSKDSTGQLFKKQDISIKITCYTPLTRPAYTTNNLAETILIYMHEIFGEALTDYTIGETDYDSDVNGYRIICHLNFHYDLTD